MVGEIVTIAVGKAGCSFNQQYWKNVLWEMGLDSDGEHYRDHVIEHYHKRACLGVLGQNKSSVFYENASGIYVPRTIFTDLSVDPIEDIMNSSISAYDDITAIYQQTDSRRSYSLAWQESRDIFPDIEEAFRRRAEDCDRLGFVQMVGGFPGGAGSGLTCRILEHILSDTYGKTPVQAIGLVSNNNSQSLPEFYNQMFAFKMLHEFTRQIVCLEPGMLATCARRTWGRGTSYHINKVVANIMCSLSGPYRCPSGNSMKINQQLKYLCTNNNLKFHTAGLIALREESELKKQFLRDVRASVFRSRDSVCAYEAGVSLASCGIFRGGFGYSAYSRLINEADPSACALSEINGKCYGLDSTFVNLHNDTCMGIVIDSINHYCHNGYSRKAYFHQFMVRGQIEADEFVDVLDFGVDMGQHYQMLEHKDNRPVKPDPMKRVKKDELAVHMNTRLRDFDGLVVVLDIDETLMHCRAVERPDDDDEDFELDEKDFDFHVDFTMENQMKKYFVSCRPHLQEFFEFVSTHDDIFLCVWTAAAKPYAECALIHALGWKVNRINLLWHRKHFREFNERKNIKALAKYLCVNVEDILMVDDNKHAFSSSWIRRGIVELIDAYRHPEKQQDDEELLRIMDVIDERLDHMFG